MKRIMQVVASIELSVDRPSAIDAAALEAIAKLNCDFAMDCSDNGAFGAKIVAKEIQCYDDERLFNLVLETTGTNEAQFIKSKTWNASQARRLFAYYARKYLEWDWRQIATVVRRNQATIADGVDEMMRLISGDGDEQRAVQVLEDMCRIQKQWAEAKR